MSPTSYRTAPPRVMLCREPAFASRLRRGRLQTANEPDGWIPATRTFNCNTRRDASSSAQRHSSDRLLRAVLLDRVVLDLLLHGRRTDTFGRDARSAGSLRSDSDVGLVRNNARAVDGFGARKRPRLMGPDWRGNDVDVRRATDGGRRNHDYPP